MNPAAASQRRRAIWIVPLMLLAIVAICLHGATRRRIWVRSGDTLVEPPTKSSTQPARPFVSRFRVAVFNIESGRGTDGKTDLTRITQLLSSFDLIGLNEVRGAFSGPSQARRLGGSLSLPWLFAPTETRWWHDDIGNGLLTRLPVEHWTIQPLGTARTQAWRNVIHARIPLANDVVLNVLITHIDRRADRLSQLRQVAQLFLAMDEPAILMGDLNTAGVSEEFAGELSSHAGVTDPVGDTPKLSAKERIDWILTRGLRTIDGGAVQSAASSHPLIWAELEVPAPPITQPIQPPVEAPTTRQSTTQSTTRSTTRASSATDSASSPPR